MISIVIGAILAALLAAFLITVHVLGCGSLRPSRLPVLFWVLLAGSTQRKRLRRILAVRPPQYPAIARMEREVYGREFEHAGSEEQRRAEIHAVARKNGLDAGAFETLITQVKASPAWRAECPRGHADQMWVEGLGQMCPACGEADLREHRSNLRWERRS